MGGGRQALVALLGGLAVACLLVAGGIFRKPASTGLLQMHNRRQTMLENRAMPLGRAATAFVDQWTHLASPDFQSPMEVLSARAAGVPVIYPSVVMDKSGALQRDVAPQMLRAIQKPAFNVVPSSASSKLACVCGTCDPKAGFPPVCNACQCEELQDAAEDVFMAGHVSFLIEEGRPQTQGS
ncbi:hypothetical protein T484DRAFT_1774901 [Baffinella frigidus]|nr:hypothetical protein T484DRAFT_1774901 [Cryptophyta sp. CCMP2293]